MIIEWIRFFKESNSSEEIRRAKICVNCPYSRKAPFLQMIKGEIEEIEDLYCDLCKCPIKFKIKTDKAKHTCDKWL